MCDVNLETDAGVVVSGFELRDRICADLAARSIAQPPFIFMTGDLVDAAMNEQVGRQHSLFLQKPFRIAELISLLNETLAPATVLQPKKSAS